VFDGREICRQHFLDRLYVFGSANAVLYRADLVRAKPAFYNEANIHGDTEVCFTLLKTSDFGFVHQILTFTRARPESLSTISANLQTHFAGWLQLLLAHASNYLTQDELDDLLERHVSEYYQFLGKTLLLGHKNTLDYHRHKLMEAGVGFSWPRVVKGALATISGHALSPKTTGEKPLRTKSRLGACERL
jgi:hypothetical protein